MGSRSRISAAYATVTGWADCFELCPSRGSADAPDRRRKAANSQAGALRIGQCCAVGPSLLAFRVRRNRELVSHRPSRMAVGSALSLAAIARGQH